MNEYLFSSVDQKIKALEMEIAEFEELKDRMDEDDRDWQRMTEEERGRFRRYVLEIELRRNVIVLEKLIRKRMVDDERSRYLILHLEEAIGVLKLFPGYIPPPEYKPNFWGAEVIDAYRNQEGDRAIWFHVKLLVGQDGNGRRWSGVSTEEQMLFVLTMIRQQLKLFGPEFKVQSWREGGRVMVLCTIPDDETKEDGYLFLRQIVEPVLKQLQAFQTVEEVRQALNNL
jgi:hypothetical protein